MATRFERRDFLTGIAAGTVGVWTFGSSRPSFGQGPNERVRWACIGVGGKGQSDAEQAARTGDIVAACDVDASQLDGFLNGEELKKHNPGAAKAQRFSDFRKLFEQVGNSIDAVTISGPDHMHAAAALMAMRMGKHVYCQKPLTRTPYEARLLRETAAAQNVCTQMGNQGTAEDGLRRAVELVQAGVVGNITEIHVWTNRPVWPQAPEITKRPDREDPIPKNLDWDSWLGPAPLRPYVKDTYHAFKWRGWWDFGTGAMGDMACHTANMAYLAAKLGLPTKIKAESGPVNPETFPEWAHIKYDYPAREGLPPCVLHWYEGKRPGEGKVLPPKELLAKVMKEGEKLADSGSLLVGEKGIIFSPNDYGAEFRITPKPADDAFPDIPKTLPRNGRGDLGMKQELVEAIRAGKPEVALSNFRYAATLTEGMLLGNVSIRLGGKELEYDPNTGMVTNCAEAAAFVKPEYRSGWTL